MIELRVTGENLSDVIRQLSLTLDEKSVEPVKPVESVEAVKPVEAPQAVEETPAPAAEEAPTPVEKPAPKKRTPKSKKEEAPAPAPVAEPVEAKEEPAPAPVEEAPAPAVEPDPAPAAEEPAPAENEPEKEEAVTYTEEDVRKALINLKDTQGREALVSLLKDFGVKNFKEIPSARYGEVMAKVAAEVQ